MKILNISYVLPIKGKGTENDIVLRFQDYMIQNHNHQYTIIKFLPFVNNLLSRISSKWKMYHNFHLKGKIKLEGHNAFIFPWILPPTSNHIINYFFLPINRIFYILFLRKKIKPLIKDKDLILSQTLFPDSILAYWIHKDFNIPYIINLRGTISNFFLKWPLINSIFKYSKNIITPSPTNYNKFSSMLSINFIPHPLEDDFINKKYNKKYDMIRIVSVCRLIKLKNLDWVLNALSKLKKYKIKFEYIIIGNGPELNNLKALTKELGLNNEIKFEGYKEKDYIIKALSKAHIFVMPSFPETLGRSFLEAAYLGCLCIGHKNTGIDGLFKNNKSALFVDKNTIDRCLFTLVNNFSIEYINKFAFESKKIVKNLSWDYVGNKYNEIYLKAIKK